MSWDHLRIEIPKNYLDLPTFEKYFNLQSNYIENIGHALYKDQLLITIMFNNKAQKIYETQCDWILINFIFLKVKDIILTPLHFTLNHNLILDVKYINITDDLYQIIFTFLALEGNVRLSFITKQVEFNPLNPHLTQKVLL